MKLPSIRKSYFYGFTFVVLSVALLSYLQIYEGFVPCALCLLQRWTVILLGGLFFLGALLPLSKWPNVLLAALNIFFSCIGILLAGRQVWLQHIPSPQANCAGSLEFMLQVFPVKEVLRQVFQGSAECSQVEWKFLSLSLADWSLFVFALLLIFSLWQLLRVAKSYK